MAEVQKEYVLKQNDVKPKIITKKKWSKKETEMFYYAI